MRSVSVHWRSVISYGVHKIKSCGLRSMTWRSVISYGVHKIKSCGLRSMTWRSVISYGVHKIKSCGLRSTTWRSVISYGVHKIKSCGLRSTTFCVAVTWSRFSRPPTWKMGMLHIVLERYFMLANLRCFVTRCFLRYSVFVAVPGLLSSLNPGVCCRTSCVRNFLVRSKWITLQKQR